MAKRDYYEVLEVSRTSTPDQIKKAYRKLAVKWHPDKNPDNLKEAEERFKEIGEAYTILSDPDKRSHYDRYGFEGPDSSATGFSSAHTFDFSDANDIFRRFFGGRDPFAHFMDDDFFGMSEEHQPNRSSRRSRDPFSMFSSFGDFGFGDFGSDMTGGTTQFFSSSSSSTGGRGATSKSVRTFTTTQNGQTVTKTITTITRPDGSTETQEVVSQGDQGPRGRIGYRHH